MEQRYPRRGRWVLGLSATLWIGAVGCVASHSMDGDDAGLPTDAGIDAYVPGWDASVDASTSFDAGAPRGCEAEDAVEGWCTPELECDAAPTWHWNGDECVPIPCGLCVGDDCYTGAATLAECAATHAACSPQR